MLDRIRTWIKELKKLHGLWWVVIILLGLWMATVIVTIFSGRVNPPFYAATAAWIVTAILIAKDKPSILRAVFVCIFGMGGIFLMIWAKTF